MVFYSNQSVCDGDEFLQYLDRRKWQHFNDYKSDKLTSGDRMVSGRLNAEICDVIAIYKEFVGVRSLVRTSRSLRLMEFDNRRDPDFGGYGVSGQESVDGLMVRVNGFVASVGGRGGVVNVVMDRRVVKDGMYSDLVTFVGVFYWG